MDNLIKLYTSLREGTEVPEIYALWAGLSGISACLGRRVWLDMGTFTIYPNMYVVLVAGLGRYRKSTSIEMMDRLLHDIEPPLNLISQKITPEALIDALINSPQAESKVVLGASTGYLVVDELAVFLNKNSYDSGLGTLLIPLFDCKRVIEYRTKGRGIERMENVCLGMIAGTTVSLIRSAIPLDAIGGGLTSRMIFVLVEQPCPPVAWPCYDDAKRHVEEQVLRRLMEIRDVEGEVTLNMGARQFYEKEYNDFYNTTEMYDNPFLSGYASRRHVHMLKLGMVFSFCESLSRVVEDRHLHQALTVLQETEKNMSRVISLITTSEKGSLVEAVREFIQGQGKIARAEILRAFSHRLDSFELEKVLQTLLASDRVVMRSDGRVMYYEGKKS